MPPKVAYIHKSLFLILTICPLKVVIAVPDISFPPEPSITQVDNSCLYLEYCQSPWKRKESRRSMHWLLHLPQ